MKIKDRYEGLLNGVEEAVTRFEIHGDSNAKVIATVAVGVGVTLFAGVAVAAVVGGFFLFQERDAVSSFLKGKPIRPKALNAEHWGAAFEPGSGKLKGGGEKVIGRVRKGVCAFFLGRHVALLCAHVTLFFLLVVISGM